jgi:hypothetical protein
MTIDLYYLPGSAPCRSVLLAARAVGVDLNLKLTNLMEGAHMTPEFLKVKYVVKLFVHIYTFMSSCLPRGKRVKCDFVNGLKTQDLPHRLS